MRAGGCILWVVITRIPDQFARSVVGCLALGALLIIAVVRATSTVTNEQLIISARNTGHLLLISHSLSDPIFWKLQMVIRSVAPSRMRTIPQYVLSRQNNFSCSKALIRPSAAYVGLSGWRIHLLIPHALSHNSDHYCKSTINEETSSPWQR